jgi:hypothetical protein
MADPGLRAVAMKEAIRSPMPDCTPMDLHKAAILTEERRNEFRALQAAEAGYRRGADALRQFIEEQVRKNRGLTDKELLMDALKAHPTVKPTQLVVDALLDCTERGDVVLDPIHRFRHDDSRRRKDWPARLRRRI